MASLTSRELSILFCALPETILRLKEMEDTLRVGPDHNQPWYRSQKEHCVGWAADFEGPGAYLRKPVGLRGARKLYSQLVCTPALYWIIAASGVDGALAAKAWDAAMAHPNNRMAARTGQLRQLVSWGVVEGALCSRGPITKSEWRSALTVITDAQERLRNKAYSAAAWEAARTYENKEAFAAMSIEKIIESLPERTFSERLRMRENAQRWLAEKDKVKATSAAQLIGALDKLEEEERAELNAKLSGMSEAERVARAFTQDPPSETEVKIISVLAAHPGLTSAELSERLGWKGQTWHMHFGTMCQKREHNLWPSEPSKKRDAQFYSGILADLDLDRGTWTMKPEVSVALAEIGVL